MMLGRLWRWWTGRHDRWANKFIQEFVEVFPDRCPVCAFHRYGVSHFMIPPSTPVAEHSYCPEVNHGR